MLKEKVGPLMRAQGYRRRREGTYEKREGDLLATVNFQRSVHNTADLVEFTINLSVANEPIMQQYMETAQRHYEQGTPKRLKVLDGSWSCRIGELLSGFDSWWTFQSDEPTESVVGNVLRCGWSRLRYRGSNLRWIGLRIANPLCCRH